MSRHPHRPLLGLIPSLGSEHQLLRTGEESQVKLSTHPRWVPEQGLVSLAPWAAPAPTTAPAGAHC